MTVLVIGVASMILGFAICEYIRGLVLHRARIERRVDQVCRTALPSRPRFQRPADAMFGRLPAARTFGRAHRGQASHG